MSAFRDYVPSVREALRPGVIREWREAKELGLTIPTLRSARSAHLDLLPSLAILDRRLVLDIGANVGDWTAALLHVAPHARVMAIEPGPGPRSELERRYAGDTRVTVESRALDAEEGSREFHLTEAAVNASFHKPLARMEELYVDGWSVLKTVTVPTTTVDEVTAGEPVAVMKVDVQGAEPEVLAGAQQTLSRTSAILIEVNFVSHYEGDATFPRVHELLAGSGFELAGLTQAPFKSLRNTIPWADACYVPAGGVD